VLDAREKEDYNESHIITAKRAIKVYKEKILLCLPVLFYLIIGQQLLRYNFLVAFIYVHIYLRANSFPLFF